MRKKGGLENSGLHQASHLARHEGGKEGVVEGRVKESKGAKWKGGT